MTRTLAWVVAAMIVSAPALRAETPQQAMLPVKVNEIPRGDVLAAVAGDDVLVPSSFLQQLGLEKLRGDVREVGGEKYVSLRSLAPKISFVFNPDELTLAITADPQLLGHDVLELHRPGAAALDRGGDPTAFFNYALSGSKSGTPSFFGEIGASRGNSLLYSGFSRAGSSGIVRGMSYINIDSPGKLRRWTLGDSVVTTDPLGGNASLAGITVAREFTLQPYLLRWPSVDITGTAVTPSTVEVYVNGQLTNRVAVNPGTFTLHDLPATGGLGATRLVVRDVFGRESVQQGSYYYSTAALKKGLSEYLFSAGALRTDVSKSFSYGDPAAVAQYRRGMTNRVTLGGRAEATKDLVNGGPRVTLGMPIGDIDLEVAGSSASGRTGTATSASYRFTTMRYSFGFAGSQRSDDYATISLDPSQDRITRDVNVFLSRSFGLLSLGVTGNLNRMRSGEKVQHVALQSTLSMGRWGSLFTSLGSMERSGKRSPELLVGMTVGIGHSTSANVLYQKNDEVNGVQLELRRPLTQANGFGYALQSNTAADTQSAQLQYQTSYGRYEVNVDPKRASEASYNVSGGLVYIGRSLLLTRAVQESYALARVGAPNVKIFASNQEIGRTNRSGDLLVTNLLPHYGNDLRLADKDLPIDYIVESTQVTVVPPSRGGVIARFPVHVVRGYTGRMVLMVVGRPFTPSLGEVDVRNSAGETVTLALGRSGEFYSEDLPPGNYDANLRIGSVGCKFKLVLPSSNAPVTDVGMISCAP